MRKIIIDCDPGIDDALAIMLAVNSPELEIVAITTVSGNVPSDMGAVNAKKVLKQLNRLDIPVYIGEDAPLREEYIDARDTHGMDGLGESFLPEVSSGCEKQSAVDFLTEILEKEKISIIALGPMTNLARLIQKNPAAFAAIDELVSMGGAFKSHGNCSPVAEYNYWADPDAAALVYETAAMQNRLIHMVGLDVTRQIVLTPDLISYLKRLDSKTGSFVEAITKFYLDFHWEWEHMIGCVINDPLAVAYFADHSLCSGFDAYTAVETVGISIGQTVVDSMNFYKKESNSVVLTQTDPVRFFTFFFSRLLNKTPDELDLLSDMVRSPKQVRVNS